MLVMITKPQLVTTAVTRLGWPTTTVSQVLVTRRQAGPIMAWTRAGMAIQHANNKLVRSDARFRYSRDFTFRFFILIPFIAVFALSQNHFANHPKSHPCLSRRL